MSALGLTIFTATTVDLSIGSIPYASALTTLPKAPDLNWGKNYEKSKRNVMLGISQRARKF